MTLCLPGRIPGPHGPVGWPIWLAVAGLFIGIPGLGGIVGGAGQGLELLTGIPAAIIAVVAMIILASSSYRYLERIMLVLVMGFTATTILSAVMMQFTEHQLTSDDLATGLAFDFPLEYAALAIAMYGYTGVNSGEISAYTYWCVEKGYPKYIGADRDDPGVARAKGWIKVLHTDVWATLIILTFATVPFFILGAGVLFESGTTPEGIDAVKVLSGMFTETLGPWSMWVFGLGAFFILFSTTLSGIGAGGRVFPDARSNLDRQPPDDSARKVDAHLRGHRTVTRLPALHRVGATAHTARADLGNVRGHLAADPELVGNLRVPVADDDLRARLSLLRVGIFVWSTRYGVQRSR